MSEKERSNNLRNNLEKLKSILNKLEKILLLGVIVDLMCTVVLITFTISHLIGNGRFEGVVNVNIVVPLIIISSLFYMIIGGKYYSLKNKHKKVIFEANLIQEIEIERKKKKDFQSKLSKIKKIMVTTLIIDSIFAVEFIALIISHLIGNGRFEGVVNVNIIVPLIFVNICLFTILVGRYYFLKNKHTMPQIKSSTIVDKRSEPYQLQEMLQVHSSNQPEMKYCGNCGCSLEFTAKFCEECGTEQL